MQERFAEMRRSKASANKMTACLQGELKLAKQPIKLLSYQTVRQGWTPIEKQREFLNERYG